MRSKVSVEVLGKLPRISRRFGRASKVRSKVASKVGVFQWAGDTVDHPPAPLGGPLRFALRFALSLRSSGGSKSGIMPHHVWTA